MGERDIRIVEVTGSSPAVSTIKAYSTFVLYAFYFVQMTDGRRTRPDDGVNKTIQ